MTDGKTVGIFLASPADVRAERDAAERVVARLDGKYKNHVRLVSRRWERGFYEARQGFQEAIGAMDRHDVVIGILWSRLGTPLPAAVFRRPNGTVYESGTTFEIETALELSERTEGQPAVYLFRKTEPVRYAAATVDEDRAQFEALQAWWDRVVRNPAKTRGHHGFVTTDEFERKLEDLLEDYLIRKDLIPSGPTWDIATRKSPYPGLLAYDSRFADVFYGRSLAIAEILADLHQLERRSTRALVVIGPSGSGKSSLVRAGIAPEFSDFTFGADRWRHVLLEPADDPVLALARRLFDETCLPELTASPQATPESLAALIRQSPSAAVNTVGWALRRVPASLLLIFDQVETFLGRDDQLCLTQFAYELVEDETTWLLATIRNDQYAEVQRDPSLLSLRKGGALYDLPPPGRSELREIVRGPARAAGLVFEERDGRSLADDILAAVKDADALPLLQMTLAQLFDNRVGNVLTYAAYERMGGLEGAIAAHAQQTFDKLSPAAQARLDAVLRHLVSDITADGRLTLRSAPRKEILSEEPVLTEELLTALVNARLLVDADDNVRVAHEALLRHWGRAKLSPALRPDVVALRRHLEPAYDVWQVERKTADLLPQGSVLAAASEIVEGYPGAFEPLLEDYIRRSARRARAQLLAARRRSWVAIAVAVVMAIGVGVVFRLYVDTKNNLMLGLLTKGYESLVADQPARTYNLVAPALAQGPFGGFIDAEQAVRLRTIAGVVAPAVVNPSQTIENVAPGAAAMAVDVSSDGSRIIVGYDDGSSYVFPRPSNRSSVLHLVGNTKNVENIGAHFDSTGTLAVTATSDEALFWNLTTGVRRSLPAIFSSKLSAIAIAPRGDAVALGTRDGTVAIWTPKTNAMRVFAREHTGQTEDLSFDSTGRELASAGDDGTVITRDTATWNVRDRIKTNRGTLSSVALSPAGKYIATAALRGPVDVWSAKHGRYDDDPVDVPEERRWKIRFSPNGKILAVASYDGTVRLWNTEALARDLPLENQATIDGNDLRVDDLAFTGDSAQLVTASQSGAVRVWDVTNVRPVFHIVHDDSVETVTARYSANGAWFVAGGIDGLARLYAVQPDGNLSFRCSVYHGNRVLSVAFSPDSSEVVSAGMAEGQARTDDDIKVWRTPDCRPAATSLSRGADYPLSVAHSANAIAWGSRGGPIRVAQIGGHHERGRPFGGTSALPIGEVYGLAFSPDGTALVSGGTDGIVRRWNVQNGSAQVFAGSSEAIYSVAFSSDGRYVAAGGDSDYVYVWDASSGKLLKTLSEIGGTSNVDFLKEKAGDVLAAGGDARYISMWRVGSWQKLFQLGDADVRGLVGERGLYGFQQATGDLAFDGENGIIRVLSRPLDSHSAALTGSVHGINVTFDRADDSAMAALPATTLPASHR